MSEFIAITLHGQFVGLHGVYCLLHGVNEFSVWCKKASVLLCIARSERKQFNLVLAQVLLTASDDVLNSTHMDGSAFTHCQFILL